MTLDTVYGFYHGQDPRTFTPDREMCSPKEVERWEEAVKLAKVGQWQPDGSGCHSNLDNSIIICRSSMGLGTYTVVVDDDGEFIRDATYQDIQEIL